MPLVTKFTSTFTCIQSPLPPRLAKFHPIVVSFQKSKILSTKLSLGDNGASLEQFFEYSSYFSKIYELKAQVICPFPPHPVETRIITIVLSFKKRKNERDTNLFWDEPFFFLGISLRLCKRLRFVEQRRICEECP